MGYTIGSKGDSVKTPGETEQDYMNLFNKNDAAIWQYHQQTGKPLEDSFQAVTGKPWPAGRSIKWVGGNKGNSGNGFEFTADRTVKSVLGKYVAIPAAYTAAVLATGGAASPLLLGLGGGGAAAGAGGGVAAGGLGTGALAAGATIPGAGAVTGSIIGAGGASLGTIGSGSLLSSLGASATKAGVSKALGAYAQSDASNRGAQTAAMLDRNSQFETELMARERNARLAQTDSYANSMQAQNGMNWHPAVRPTGIPGSTPDLNPQSRDASTALYQQALAKLKAGDTLPPLDPMTNLPLKPGVGERLAGYGSLAMSLLGR